MTVLGKTQISGALLAFDHALADEALVSIERVRKKARTEALKLGRTLGLAPEDNALAPTASVDEVLAGAAALFSTLWLDDALRRALRPTLPEMQNTDGEPLEFFTLHFPFSSKAKLPAVRLALDALPALSKAKEDFWNWRETTKKSGKASARNMSVRKDANAQTFSATMDSGATVLGNV
ncbi:MAG: hypothetical protein HC788_09585, partial [Sphingopyxis sp.]|nr:hypothetical protein [Sphingopyxis sp.]